MDARETLSKAKELYNLVAELIMETRQEEFDTKRKVIEEKLKEIESIHELGDFSQNIKSILEMFSSNPLDENNKRESLLNLLSALSSQRTKLTQKFGFCSEPE